MGQGLYRCVGFGAVDAPGVNWDKFDDIYDIVRTSYECKQNYVMIPIAIDEGWLRRAWNLSELPEGLPHVQDRTAVAVQRCESWPDVGKKGIWISHRIVKTWEVIRNLAKEKGIDLPEGEPVFASDWD